MEKRVPVNKFYLGLRTTSNYESYFNWLAGKDEVKQWMRAGEQMEEKLLKLKLIKKSSRNVYDSNDSSDELTGILMAFFQIIFCVSFIFHFLETTVGETSHLTTESDDENQKQASGCEIQNIAQPPVKKRKSQTKEKRSTVETIIIE